MSVWWMVRAGDNNELIDIWLQKGIVSVGWADLGDISKFTDRGKLLTLADKVYSGDKPKSRQSAANQLWRFANEIEVGHKIVTYSKEKREYIVGQVTKTYTFNPKMVNAHYPNIVEVKWGAQRVSRDELTQVSKNTLGSTLTVFRVDSCEPEFEALMSGVVATTGKSSSSTQVFSQTNLPDLEGQIQSMVQDLIDGLDEWQMQELVGGLLHAMGYENVKVSPKGPDGGVDVLASKDAFGFEKPIVKVQVKHKLSSAGSPEIQQLKGALPLDASSLFVSTGGFTSKGLQMAKSNDVRTLDLEELVLLVLEWYEKMPTSVQSMIPLKKVYIPMG